MPTIKCFTVSLTTGLLDQNEIRPNVAVAPLLNLESRKSGRACSWPSIHRSLPDKPGTTHPIPPLLQSDALECLCLSGLV